MSIVSPDGTIQLLEEELVKALAHVRREIRDAKMAINQEGCLPTRILIPKGITFGGLPVEMEP